MKQANRSTSEPIVIIVDDDAGVRNAIRLLVRSIGLQAETFGSGREFLDAFDPDRPGCLVLDVRMPGMSGLEVQKRLLKRRASIPIIFVTAHGDVPMAVDAVKAGALDFVQKPFRDQDLIDRIQEALDQDKRMRRDSADRQEIEQRIESLTPRELEVMDMVVAGNPNKVIAIDLGLSERTVEIHRARVMEKMQADSLPHLVRMVVKAQR
jgi:RNA polymerase sigma factor (sigma-70 family)